MLLLVTVFATAQQNRYVVHFTDKSSSPYNVSDPTKYLSSKAISRRIKQEIPVTLGDLPVNPGYVDQLNNAGAKVFYTSRWLNCALVQTTTTVAASLSMLPFVKEVEYVAPGARLTPGRVKANKTRKQTGVAAATKAQLEMVGIDDMQADDMYGQGVHVAILDAGFDGVNTGAPFKHLFEENRVVQVHDFVQNTKDVYRYDDHGTEVFSVMAASSDSYTGGAHKASFYLYVTEDVPTEFRIEEYNWLFAVERADSAGVDVITTSLGYNTFDDDAMDYSKAELNGKVAVISIAAATALEKGIVVVTSAGNEGTNSWRTITPPADVDGVIAVGSVTSAGVRSTFSSTGPTSDNRIKPDVVAMGSGVSVVRPNGTNGFASGTSLAAPIVTSLVIGLIQRFHETIDPNVIAETIISTASQSDRPDNLLGYGIPNYSAVKAELQGLLPLEEISVYPNPTDTGRFSIRFKTTGTTATITVYDLMGRILSTHQVNVTSENNPLEINVADLPASSYLVKVKTTDNFKTFRLVKL